MIRVSFTGHRSINVNKVRPMLYDTIEKLIKEGAVEFNAGGAYGFDTVAALCVIEKKDTAPWIKLNLILPCPPKEQTGRFSDKSRNIYEELLWKADKREIVSLSYSSECMKERNRRLVDCADVLVCWYDKKEFRSGTGQTIRMAEQKGLRTINLFRM